MFFFFPTMHTEAARVHHRPADTPQPPSHDKIICWVHSIECKAIDRYLICIIHSFDCNFVYIVNIIIIQMNQLHLYYIHTLCYSVSEGEAGLLKWQSFPVQRPLCMQKIKIVWIINILKREKFKIVILWTIFEISSQEWYQKGIIVTVI